MKKLNLYLSITILVIIVITVSVYQIQRNIISDLRRQILKLQLQNNHIEQVNDSLYTVNVLLTNNLNFLKDSLKFLKHEVIQYQNVSLKWKNKYFKILTNVTVFKDTFYIKFNKKYGILTVDGLVKYILKNKKAEVNLNLLYEPLEITIALERYKNEPVVSWIKVSDTTIIISKVNIVTKESLFYKKNKGYVFGYEYSSFSGHGVFVGYRFEPFVVGVTIHKSEISLSILLQI